MLPPLGWMTKASARCQVVPRLAFSVIEILAGTLIDPHEVTRADCFSDEVYGNDLRRVENFSMSPRASSRLGLANGIVCSSM